MVTGHPVWAVFAYIAGVVQTEAEEATDDTTLRVGWTVVDAGVVRGIA
jgi:hypothetical protein